MKKKSISKKFEEKVKPLEIGDVCKIESERNIRHAGRPLNGRYGKIIELGKSPNGEVIVHFELQPLPQSRDRSYEQAKQDNMHFMEYGGRRGYSPRAIEKIWIAPTALKFVRTEEDEQFKKRLKQAQDHNQPKRDWRGNLVKPQGRYNLATGEVEVVHNDAIRAAMGRALGFE